MGTARREALDHLLIFGRRYLGRVLIEFIGHYHAARPHQGWSAVTALVACSTSTAGLPEEVTPNGLTGHPLDEHGHDLLGEERVALGERGDSSSERRGTGGRRRRG